MKTGIHRKSPRGPAAKARPGVDPQVSSPPPYDPMTPRIPIGLKGRKNKMPMKPMPKSPGGANVGW